MRNYDMRDEKNLLVAHFFKRRLSTKQGIEVMATVIADHVRDLDGLEMIFTDMRSYFINGKSKSQRAPIQ